MKSRVRLRRLPSGINNREPIFNNLAGGDSGSSDPNGADDLGAESIIVLSLELDETREVSERNREMLVPPWILSVGDDASASNGGAGDGDLNVGVTGDDLVVMVLLLLLGVEDGTSRSGKQGAAGGKAAAEALGEDVHIGETTGFDDPKLKVTVEEHRVIG